LLHLDSDGLHGDLGEATTNSGITRLNVVEFHTAGVVLLEVSCLLSGLLLLSGGLLLLLLHDFVEINVLLFLSALNLSSEGGLSEFPPNFSLTLGLLFGGLFGSELDSKLLSDLSGLLVLLLLFGDLNLLLLVDAHLLFGDLNGLSRNRGEFFGTTLGLATSRLGLDLNLFNGNGLFNDGLLYFGSLSLKLSLFGGGSLVGLLLLSL
jgi:hypothetical protein